MYAETIKNKTASPFRSTTINLMYPRKVDGKIVAGVDVIRDIVNIAIDNDIIKRTGAWFLIPGLDKKINGIAKIYDLYYTDKEEYNKLYKLVEEYYASEEN